MKNVIEVEKLVREFKVHGEARGSFRLIKKLFSQGGERKRVVDEVSFTIQKGEFIGYIGPNGAGKSTTIKMLSGVLVPTSGSVRVMGLEPHKQRKEHAKHIGVVFGQRTQLWWDLPLKDSFYLLGKIYNIPEQRYKENLDLFCDILDLGSFLHTPVRQLSLGQRMRGDIAASLIHDPQVLFLDEPTIGLDLLAKERIQDFLQTINREKQITILLTTHNLDDIEKLCRRVIFIDHGKVLFDGSSLEMIRTFGDKKYVVVESNGWSPERWKGPVPDKIEPNELWFGVEDDAEIAPMIRRLSDLLPIHNLTVREPKIEDIMKELYKRTHAGGVQSTKLVENVV